MEMILYLILTLIFVSYVQESWMETIFICPIMLFLFHIFRRAGWRLYLPVVRMAAPCTV